MALIIRDRVWESSASTGTGNFVLAGTKTGYRAFSSVLDDGDTCFYTIVADNGLWETGLGTYNSGTNSLTRTARYDNSSGTTAAINFAVGAKEIFLSLPADRFKEKLSSSANLQDLNSASDARTALGLGAAAVAGVYTGGTTPSSSDVMSSSPATIELYYTGSGARSSHIDFHARDSTDYDARIIRNSGASGELILINTNGSAVNTVLLNSTQQLVQFNYAGNAGVRVYNYAPGGGGRIGMMRIDADGVTAGAGYIEFQYNGSLAGSVTVASSSSVAFNTTSDYRLKEQVLPMEGALDRIMAAKPVTYKWKSDGSAGEGFIAHELAEVVPLAVTGEKDAVDEDGKPKHQQVDYSKLVPLLTKGIQDLVAEVTTLKQRIAVLENAE